MSLKKRNQEKRKDRKKLRKIKKQVQGITLIALVVTIIVLIILAGVSIAMLIGENGIITQAQRAKENTELAQEEEQKNLNSIVNKMEEIAQASNSIDIVPKLTQGMIPVKYVNGTGWVRTEATDSGWYNYEEKLWANVVLVGENGKDADGDEDIFDSNGVLNENSNYSMLVWIPRYAYKIRTQYHTKGTTAGEIDIVFIDTGNRGKDGKTTYSTLYPSATIGGGMSDYVVHPAFHYGDTEIEGFWVGKFETSNTKGYGDTSTANTTDLIAQIKAGVTSWRCIRVTNIFTVCTELNREGNPYGLNSSDSIVDPHMIKSSEWGAVAYLSQSKDYGKGSEVWINNSSNYITGSVGNNLNAGADEGSINDYKQAGNASTTGNITGIYDMSGGAWEYVAGYVNNDYIQNGTPYTYAQNLIDTVNAGNVKYADVYKIGSSDSRESNYEMTQPKEEQDVETSANGNYGDAVYESSSNGIDANGWNSDYSGFAYSNYPILLYGGKYSDGVNSGIFAFGNSDGLSDAPYGFRTVMTVL